MHCRIRDILNILNELAPFALQEDWDNSGLMIGDTDRTADGLYLDLDLTDQTVQAAKEAGVNTIVTHHPILFDPPRSLRTDQYPGSAIAKALQADLQVIAAHTNLDHAAGGVNDALAAILGVEEALPLPDRIGRMAEVQEEPAEKWLIRTAQKLRTRPRYIGDPQQPIRRILLCGGACGELAESQTNPPADLILTSEVKHHQALAALQQGVFVIDAGHYETEYPVLGQLAAALESRVDLPVVIAPFVPPLRFHGESTV